MSISEILTDIKNFLIDFNEEIVILKISDLTAGDIYNEEEYNALLKIFQE